MFLNLGIFKAITRLARSLYQKYDDKNVARIQILSKTTF